MLDAAPRARWLAAPGPATAGTARRGILRITAQQPVHGARVQLSADGPIALPQRELTFGALDSGADRDLAVAFTPALAGSATGVVHALVTATTAGGRTVSRTVDLYLAAGGGQVAASVNGSLDAKLAALRLRAGTPKTLARARAQLLGGGAAEHITVHKVGSAAVSPSAIPVTTPVTGKILYTDSAGDTHPARTVTVELRDSDGSADGTQLVTGTTGVDGSYSLSAPTFRADGSTPRRLYLRADAQGDSFLIHPAAVAPAQHIDSTVTPAAGAALTINLTANKTDDNNTAFDVADALVTGIQYIKRINAGASLGALSVSFPDAGGTDFSSASNTARILQQDRFDWDVVLHELGHFVSHKLNIQNSPGGPHGFSQNLGENLGKDAGLRLAWDEGFATWFSLTAENALGTAALGIPKVGDSFYDDTEDGTLHVDLATGSGLGEDNELSVARVLWHVYTDPKIAVTDTGIISALKTAAVTTLSAAVPALLKADGAATFDDTGTPAAATVARSNDVACVLTDQFVSPKLTAPADGTKANADTAPAFTWQPDGAGPSNRLNSFTVQFWSPNWDKLIFQSPAQAATSYTPNAADWKTKILNGKDAAGKLPPTLKVVVKGSGTNAPATGPYKSCASSIAVNHVDLAFAIDTTGSMSPYIASVLASASSIVDSLANDGVDYRIAVIDYKDVDSDPSAGCPPDPYAAQTDLAFSATKADIQTAIGTLPGKVGGGCDTPEDVYSGVEQAIGMPWRPGVKKAIIQLGDAAGHDPETHSGYTLAKVTADAAAVDPAVVFGILVGGDLDAHTFASALATATGGTTFDATANPADTGPAILQAVNELAAAPTANAGGPYTGPAGSPIGFDGSGSAATPPAAIASYTWDFGDGTAPVTTAVPTVSHTYATALIGTVKLTVTDSAHRSGTSTASVTVTGATTPPAVVAVDSTVSADSGPAAMLAAPALTTRGPNELLLAFVSTDGPKAANQTVRQVTGGGLTWKETVRQGKQPGDAEIWTAYAPARLASVSVRATLNRTPFEGSITVVAFTGARASLGAVAIGADLSTTALAGLTTTAAGGLLYATGHDWNSALTPLAGPGQAVVHNFGDPTVRDTSWVQRVTAPSAKSGVLTTFKAGLHAGDRWNLVGVEVLPAP